MTPIVFLGAYIVDIVIGDPHRLPHPVVIIGKLVKFLEDKVRSFPFLDKKKGGVILWFVVVIPVYFITWGIVEWSFFITFWFGMIV
jgi:adenosylcobinamide-phosphate synthase